ncbi:hypothetical protein LY76DRAFT_117112 [Colletotrichum caudatum]|nr:hypothetical protein LY76DRAFT_117112 [Colletotrichum caudatum]
MSCHFFNTKYWLMTSRKMSSSPHDEGWVPRCSHGRCASHQETSLPKKQDSFDLLSVGWKKYAPFMIAEKHFYARQNGSTSTAEMTLAPTASAPAL